MGGFDFLSAAELLFEMAESDRVPSRCALLKSKLRLAGSPDADREAALAGIVCVAECDDL